MSARANWKGFLKIGELSCPVSLFTAVSTSDRIAFHTLNRATGHRVKREFIDSETGKLVDADQQVKGYEVDHGQFIVLEQDEIASALPESDKTLAVEGFVACRDIDDVYFDRPYYLAPSDAVAHEAFNLIRDGMQTRQVAALAKTVLFRRVRTVLIRPHDEGLIATTLNFDYEVRKSDDVFDEIPDKQIDGEMLDLAKHIIDTKRGKFDPAGFHDRYEGALADLVKAKLEGKVFKPPKAPVATKVSDLMEALRQSAGSPKPGGGPSAAAKGKKKVSGERENRRKVG